MKKIFFLMLFSAVALGQIKEPAGVNASTSATALKFVAAAGTGTQGFGLTQGAQFCLDGSTCVKNLASDGTTLTLTGLGLAVSGTLTTVGGNEFEATNVKAYGLNTINIKGQPADGSSAISVKVYSNSTLSTAGASITAFYNDNSQANLKARVDKDGFYIQPVQTLTVANNAVGSSAATATLIPTANYVNCTCNDPDGCAITMGETGVQDGTVVRIISTTSTACTFADTSGVSELSGALTLGQYDSLSLIYLSDRWVQLTTSNN